MVGVRKVVVDREALKHPILDKLLSQYGSVEICVAGSAEHDKTGLARSKMLVRAFNRKSSERLACPKCGSVLENFVLLKAKPNKEQLP